MARIAPLFLFTLLSATNAYYGTSACPDHSYTMVKAKIRAFILASQNAHIWPAKLLFIGFHDCFPESCDGSVAFETERRENGKVQSTIDELNRARSGTCVGLADAIKLGLELSMELTGGPKITCPKGNRADATREGPAGKLPSPVDDLETILSKYKAQGFSLSSSIASVFGGHALGGFGVDASTGLPHFPFTPQLDKFNSAYLLFATNPDTQAPSRDSEPGTFNALRSDLVIAKATSYKIRVYIKIFKRSPIAFHYAFRAFLAKMCSK